MAPKVVKYNEGQWFAVPLKQEGYALGIIVRGSYRTKGGLGYFFGPKYESVPSGAETYLKNKDNSILICHFGDLGIIKGQWPLIHESKPYKRNDWPVPLFHRILPLPEGKVVIVEYRQDYSGIEPPIRETIAAIDEEILKFPKDVFSGSKAIEIKLSKMLE